ncbi:MAG: hypothetical protein PHF87_10655 [Desulfotomaculaceae bacterium]|nr:hypothetical protein [Desulfotomaculaceae bacterium]
MINKHAMTPDQELLLTQITELRNKAVALRFEYWKKFEVFEPQWWLLFALLLVPVIIWWKLIEKKRFSQISFVGFLVAIIALELDMIGSELSLWRYPHKFIFISPRQIPIDFSVLPVLYMAAYQYISGWKQYLMVSLILALFYSFFAEPILVYMGIYELLIWKHWYSLPIYLAISVFVKWLADSLEKWRCDKLL